MIPLRDNIRSATVPYLNYLIIAINAALFGYELSLGDAVNDFVQTWGLVPATMTQEIRLGFSPKAHLAPWFTHMFLHGGWLHFLANMWFLHIFGDNVEDRLGKARFLVLYLSGGLLAGLAQVMAGPGADVPMVGASGAIAAVLGAYFIMYPRARVLSLVPVFVLFWFIELPAFVFIGLWFLMQAFQGYATLLAAQEGGGVAWWAHVGGFLAGVVLCFALKIGTAPRPCREPRGRVVVLGRR
jgi:membrane associated rhomboid family serine protease